jgi:hypothetical protein
VIRKSKTTMEENPIMEEDSDIITTITIRNLNVSFN